MLTVFWFRRDLRIEDNAGLYHALKSGNPVLPIFIFDDNILDELKHDDIRIPLIYDQLLNIDKELRSLGSSLLVRKGKPIDIFKELIEEFNVSSVYFNKDYEPYAKNRDYSLSSFFDIQGIEFKGFKDQVIFEEFDILKYDGKPYTVYTPYKNKWLLLFDSKNHQPYEKLTNGYYQFNANFPLFEFTGFTNSGNKVKPFNINNLDNYSEERNIPSVDSTSYLSPHLRFGTIGIRTLVAKFIDTNPVFLSELIWREFFMQILFHFPRVVTENFHSKYDNINWRNNKEEFELWKQGKTGYPIVDAGMRQLNTTGYMHNRVRMIVASFLTKHLLIDWRWGESYFAEKLLDYDLSANNGNWQWAAGTGCDAAPYFRVFNPWEQQKKFDKDYKYVLKWIPEYDELTYIKPMVDHKFARERALEAYKTGLSQAKSL